MKRVAALYDIHGNDFALQAVIEEMGKRSVDAVVIGGDVVWGPQPRAVMERLHTLRKTTEVYFIRGNADREVYEYSQGVFTANPMIDAVNRWCVEQLTSEQLAQLNQWPKSCVLQIDGLGEVLFVHGSPRRDDEAIRMQTPEEEVIPMIQSVEQSIIVCGHTHVPFLRKVSGKAIVNPGSLGLPAGAQGACWALLGPDIAFIETPYDREQAAKEIRNSGAPYACEFAEHILHPPVKGP